MTECPSRGWDRYTKMEEASHIPSDADMLKDLDAYGHLTWCVGFGEEGDERGDWMACFDFEVFSHPERGVLVAYHTVVNSESGGFIDTLEAAVVPAEKAPFDLPDYWASIPYYMEVLDEEIKQNAKCNEEWNAALRKELDRVKNEVA